MLDCIGSIGTTPRVQVRTDQTATRWEFRIGDAPIAVWDWVDGGPPPEQLRLVRRPRSTAKSRHAPVLMCSYTTGTMLHLESGLELDCVRALDRLLEVDWIVPQPARLRFDHRFGSRRVEHVPDLLTRDAKGAITVWDVRAPERRDDRFALRSSLTADACEHVGWDYLLFGGLSGVGRINLMWLNNYRRPQPWYPAAERDLRGLLGFGGATVATVLETDHGAGHLVSTMWHMLWSGDLVCDLTQRISGATPLSVRRSALER